MSDCIVTPLGSELEVELVEGAPALPFDLEAEVEKIWVEEGKEKRNGRVLSCLGIIEQKLLAKEVEYRQLFAAMKSEKLRPSLGLMPLAVMGIIKRDNRYLVGKRGSDVTQYPNEWEFVPSGGWEVRHRADYRQQLLEELQEELQLAPNQVQEINPIAVVHDMEALSADLCAVIELREGAAPAGDGEEVVDLKWFTLDELEKFPQLIPPCRALLEILATLSSGS